MLMTRIFFFNDTATTEIYTLSLHDALPISLAVAFDGGQLPSDGGLVWLARADTQLGLSAAFARASRSEEHTSELQAHLNLVCRLLLAKKKYQSCQSAETYWAIHT